MGEQRHASRLRRYLRTAILVVFGFAAAVPAMRAQAAPPGAGQAAAAKSVGTVKAISGKSITLAAEGGGGDVNVVVQDGARLLRIEPGQTDLKTAAPLQLEDLQPGDRILVRGQAADGGKSLLAVSVIAMKKADIAEKQKHEREEWQRHGVGGLVTAVDSAAGSITIDTSALGANKNVVVNVAKTTILRRYAPGSVKFDEATPAPLDQIKVGDQLRARGARSTDGSALAADEIVSGAFRNIAGTIVAIDAGASTITVNDLATKKPVLVKVSGTQLKKLPQPMAQRIAASLKGNSVDSDSGAPGQRPAAQPGSSSAATAPQTQSGPPNGREGARHGEQGGTPGAGAGANGGQGGTADLQQAIGRMPAASLADLQKGDAVMIVATAGAQNDGVTAITLLAGVEPILQASPTGGQSILTPWSLNGAPSGDAATQ